MDSAHTRPAPRQRLQISTVAGEASSSAGQTSTASNRMGASALMQTAIPHTLDEDEDDDDGDSSDLEHDTDLDEDADLDLDIASPLPSADPSLPDPVLLYGDVEKRTRFSLASTPSSRSRCSTPSLMSDTSLSQSLDAEEEEEDDFPSPARFALPQSHSQSPSNRSSASASPRKVSLKRSRSPSPDLPSEGEGLEAYDTPLVRALQRGRKRLRMEAAVFEGKQREGALVAATGMVEE